MNISISKFHQVNNIQRNQSTYYYRYIFTLFYVEKLNIKHLILLLNKLESNDYTVHLKWSISQVHKVIIATFILGMLWISQCYLEIYFCVSHFNPLCTNRLICRFTLLVTRYFIRHRFFYHSKLLNNNKIFIYFIQ